LTDSDRVDGCAGRLVDAGRARMISEIQDAADGAKNISTHSGMTGCSPVTTELLDRTVAEPSSLRRKRDESQNEYPGNYQRLSRGLAPSDPPIGQPENLEGKSVAQKAALSSETSAAKICRPRKLSVQGAARPFEEWTPKENQLTTKREKPSPLERAARPLVFIERLRIALKPAYVELQSLNRELEKDVDRWAALAQSLL